MSPKVIYGQIHGRNGLAVFEKTRGLCYFRGHF